MDLSIVLPSYLEEENLRLLLPRIVQVCKTLTSSFEVLVVDSIEAMDGTPSAVVDAGGIYINRAGGNHYGDAVRTGVIRSRGKHVIFMDADGSHYPEFIGKLYQHKSEADVVVASRYVKGGHTENVPMLILMSKIVNLAYRLILNIKCKDVSNSFKLYNGEQLRSLQLRSKNFDIVEEILFKLLRNNKQLSILEIPFSFKQRMFGETKRNLPKFIFTFVFTLFRLRFLTR